MSGWGKGWPDINKPWPDNKEWEKYKPEHPFDKSLYEQEWPTHTSDAITEALPPIVLNEVEISKCEPIVVKHIPKF